MFKLIILYQIIIKYCKVYKYTFKTVFAYIVTPNVLNNIPFQLSVCQLCINYYLTFKKPNRVII